MRRLTPIGIKPKWLAGSTFVELVVTLFLLATFSILVFTLLWATSKASAAQGAESASEQSKLALATFLPRLTEQVHPPYWAREDKTFENTGNDWKAFFRDGQDSNFLILRKQGNTQLDLVTPDSTISIKNLPELVIQWWKKNDRIIGVSVKWANNEFHAAWGSFLL